MPSNVVPVAVAIPDLARVCREALDASGLAAAAVAVNRAMVGTTCTDGCTEAYLQDCAERMAADLLSFSANPVEQVAFLWGVCAGFQSGMMAGASAAARAVNEASRELARK